MGRSPHATDKCTAGHAAVVTTPLSLKAGCVTQSSNPVPVVACLPRAQPIDGDVTAMVEQIVCMAAKPAAGELSSRTRSHRQRPRTR